MENREKNSGRYLHFKEDPYPPWHVDSHPPLMPTSAHTGHLFFPFIYFYFFNKALTSLLNYEVWLTELEHISMCCTVNRFLMVVNQWNHVEGVSTLSHSGGRLSPYPAARQWTPSSVSTYVAVTANVKLFRGTMLSLGLRYKSHRKCYALLWNSHAIQYGEIQIASK